MLLCDDPRTLAEFLGPDAARAPRPVGTLPPAERGLWRALGTTDEVWLSEDRVGSDFWWRTLVVTDAPSSQFDVLRARVGRDLAIEGPVACLALRGRGFHGQRSRPWAALEGNLHLSVALRPRLPARDVGLALTMLPAVATVDAVRVATEGRLLPGIKWVNDLLLEGRKVAGVITATQTLGTELDLAVMGIGLNVRRTPDVAPTPFVPAIGSLCDFAPGEGLAPAHVFWLLLESLAARYRALASEGPASLFEAYRRHSLVLGERVRIWEEGIADDGPPASWPPPLARGVVVDMAPDLSLRLRGRRRAVARGRLAFEDACRAFGL